MAPENEKWFYLYQTVAFIAACACIAFCMWVCAGCWTAHQAIIR